MCVFDSMENLNIRSIYFLGRLLRVDLIKPASMSVRPSVHTSVRLSTKNFCDSNEIYVYVEVDTRWYAIWRPCSRSKSRSFGVES